MARFGLSCDPAVVTTDLPDPVPYDQPTPVGLGMGLHHVLLAIPPGGEDAARAFYVGALGMVEVAKPPELAARGGLWVRGDALELHLGVEEGFRPARKAHPGIVVADVTALSERLARHGIEVRWDDAFPGMWRCYVDDPHGNRLELLTPHTG